MKAQQKLEVCFEKLMSIRYENEHGGTYAYVQFLAYARELVILLKLVDGSRSYIDAIEGMTWMINEYLAVPFTHRHRVIFENKKNDLQDIFGGIRYAMQSRVRSRNVAESRIHAQAA